MPETTCWSDGTPIVTPFDVLTIAIPSVAVKAGLLRHLLREYRKKRGELTRPLVDLL